MRSSYSRWIPSPRLEIRKRPLLFRYSVTLVMVAASILVGVWLKPHSDTTPFLFYYPAVLVSLWYGGFWPGMLATFLSTIAVNYFHLPPYGSFSLDTSNILRGAFFFLSFSLICWLVEVRGHRADVESDRQLQLLDLAFEPIIVRDQQDNITFWNKGAQRLYGWTKAQAQGQNIHSLLKTVFPKPFDNVMAELSTDGHWSGELVHTKKDGNTVIVSSWWTLRRRNDEEDCVLEANFDLTKQKEAERERQRSEEEVRTSQERLAAIIDSAMDGIVTLDQEQRVVAFNAAAEKIFSCSASEVVGLPVDRFIPERLQIAHRIHIRDFDQNGVTSRSMQSPGTLWGVRSTGEEFPIEATISQVSVTGHKFYTVILRDITQRKRTEEALIRSEKLASVGRLAASIAHEINNPLTAITNLLYLVQKTASLDPPIRAYLEMAESELNRVGHIAKQTLGFSRGEGPATTFRPAELLDSVLALLDRKLKEKEIRVEKHFSSDVYVHGAAGEVRQVFWNLLTNAYDAVGPQGCIKLRVSPFQNLRSRGARITIRDDGKGIYPKQILEVFEPFFTTKNTGTGLGLWISKEIVERHGGWIRVRSRTDSQQAGTVFSVFLPERTIEEDPSDQWPVDNSSDSMELFD